VRDATRVLVTSPCPSKWGGQSALADAGIVTALRNFVLPLIGDTIFNLINSYIEAQHKALSASYMGQGAGPIFLPPASGETKCLVVVRGPFGRGTTWSKPDLDEGVANLLTDIRMKALGLAGHPAFYLEVELARYNAPGGAVSAIQATPTLFYFGETAARRIGSGSKYVYVIVSAKAETIAPQPVGDGSGEPDPPNDALLAFKLGNVEIGSAVYPAPGALEIENPMLEQRVVIAAESAEDAAKPYNLFAQVVETEDPSAFEKALYDAYNTEGNKKNLRTAIGTIIDAIAPKKKEGDKPAP